MIILQSAWLAPRFLILAIFSTVFVVGNASSVTVAQSATGVNGKVDLSWVVSGNLHTRNEARC